MIDIRAYMCVRFSLKRISCGNSKCLGLNWEPELCYWNCLIVNMDPLIGFLHTFFFDKKCIKLFFIDCVQENNWQTITRSHQRWQANKQVTITLSCATKADHHLCTGTTKEQLFLTDSVDQWMCYNRCQQCTICLRCFLYDQSFLFVDCWKTMKEHVGVTTQ